MKLFCRRGGSVSLTNAGEYLFERFSRINDDFQSLMLDLDNYVEKPRGLVSTQPYGNRYSDSMLRPLYCVTALVT